MGGYSFKHNEEIRTVQKIGHSFMVPIPRSYLERFGLKKGDEVLVGLSPIENGENRTLIIRRLPE